MYKWKLEIIEDKTFKGRYFQAITNGDEIIISTDNLTKEFCEKIIKSDNEFLIKEYEKGLYDGVRIFKNNIII